MRTPSLCLVCALVSGSLGCDESRACTLAACGPQLSLSLSYEGLPVGDYTLTLDDGERRLLCEVELQAGAGADAADTTARVRCEEGARGEPGGARTVRVELFEDPEVLSVSLTSSAGTWLEAEVTPAYGEPFRPNGPDCAPECRTAQVSLVPEAAPEP